MGETGMSEPQQSIGTVPGTSETTNEQTTEESVPESTQPATTAPKPKVKITVTDAFKKTYTHKKNGKVTARIPKVTITGISTKKANKKIYDFLISKVKNRNCSYSYFIGSKIISIVVKLQIYDEWYGENFYEYYVFNVSPKTGKKLSRKQSLKALGISSKKFEARAKKAIKKYWKKTRGEFIKNDKAFKRLYNDAISKKTLKKAFPYLNTKGKLCYYVNDMPMNPAGRHGAADLMGTC